MAYQVFARKFRPQNFDSVVGQSHVTQALVQSLENQRLHHAYLLTGTRGVGKTTLARLIAKGLNCHKGVTAQPCGTCPSCLDIARGSSLDVLEIDAASRTKVEDTRDMLDNVSYVPTRDRYKIYLIDEVHMLSMHSFNALLKTLEEPPSHVVFILATTTPEKVPVTVRSRCLHFSLHPLSEKELIQSLSSVLVTEAISFEPEALAVLAKAAKGSARDALSLLEHACAFCGDKLTASALSKMLGYADSDSLALLVGQVAKSQGQEAIITLRQMLDKGVMPERLVDDLCEVLHQIALRQVALIQVAPWIETCASTYSKETIQLLYQILIVARRDMNLAPTPLIGLEMLVLRLAVFAPEVSSIAIKPGTPVHNVAPRVEPVLSAMPAAVSAPLSAPIKIVEPASMTQTSLSSRVAFTEGVQRSVSDPAGVVTPIQASTPVVASSPEVAPVGLDWDAFLAQFPRVGLLGVLVRHCVVKSVVGKDVCLLLDESQKVCLNPARQTQLEQAISSYMKQPIKLSIEPSVLGDKTPAFREATRDVQAQQQLRQDLESHETVQAIFANFDATVEQVQFHPVKEHN